jgi:hypothetical protein
MAKVPPLGVAHDWLEQQGIGEGSTVEVVNELGERFTLTLGKYREWNQTYTVKGTQIRAISAHRLLQWIQRAQGPAASV